MKALLLSDDAYDFTLSLFERCQSQGLIGMQELGLAAHTWELLNTKVTEVDPEAMKQRAEVQAKPAEDATAT
jgi:hypothetical protein